MREPVRHGIGILLNETALLGAGLLFLILLLMIPAGGYEAIFGPEGGFRLLGSAFRPDGGEAKRLLSDYLKAGLQGSLITLSLTGLGSVMCVLLPAVLVIQRELLGRRGYALILLDAVSMVPPFIWWVFFVVLGSFAEEPWEFVLPTSGGFSSVWRGLAFWGGAFVIVAISNGSFLTAHQGVEDEMKRLRKEPFVIAARARGVAGFRFYARHLCAPGISIGLERLGGILGNCLLAEMLMNIPGLSWQGKAAYENTGEKYLIVWVIIATFCLVFVRGVNAAGRFAMTRVDPRMRQPAFGTGAVT